MKAVISTLPILKFHSCRSLCIGKQHPICILASRKNINTESKHKIYQLVVEAGTHPAETQPQLLRPASTSYAWTSSRLNMPTKYKRSWVLSEQELFQVNLYPEVWKPTNYSSSRWVPDLTSLHILCRSLSSFRRGPTRQSCLRRCLFRGRLLSARRL
jgi:hypothetical protein